MSDSNIEYQQEINQSYMGDLDKEFELLWDDQEDVVQNNQEDDRTLLESVGTFVKELPTQIAGGVGDATNTTIDLARSTGEALGIPNYTLQLYNEDDEFDPLFLDPETVKEKGGLKTGWFPKLPDSSTAGGDAIRAITRFVTGFIPASKGLKAVGATKGLLTDVAAGGIAEGIVNDPHQSRLSTLLNEVPGLSIIIPDYLADNNPEHESEWEGRIKNILEGSTLGGLSDAALNSVSKIFKSYKSYKSKNILKLDGKTTGKDTVLDGIIQPKDIDMGPEEILTTNKDGSVFVNHARIRVAKDVHNVIQNMADQSKIAASKTHQEIKKASLKQYKEIEDLLGRPTSIPFTSEEATAARTILHSSAKGVAKLAKLAKDPLASPVDFIKFQNAVAGHSAIQEVVFAGRKATAQSLNAWKIPLGSSALRGKHINDMLAGNTKDIKTLAKAISDIDDNGGNVSEAIGKSTMQKWSGSFYQVWINGLLSSPVTHAANMMSNISTTMMAVPEKYMSAAFQAMNGNGGQALIEANARLTGFAGGIKDGLQLLVSKNPDDRITAGLKTEGRTNAISSEEWGIQPESVIGKGIDYLGRTIGAPGWALEKGDLFFKGWNSRMMLQEQAAKTALSEGLTGQEYKKRVAYLLQNPTDPMIDVSSDFARYQTFTNEGGEITNAIRHAVGVVPGAKYVVPFIRTPANILNYSLERTPLAFAMSDVRTALKKGGSTAAEAKARMAAGSLLMLGASTLVLDGKLTGSGPSNWKQRKTLEDTGWQPYSVKIEDKYYSYERFEPLSSILGYSADITSIMGGIDQGEGDNLVVSGLAAFARNFSSKTYLSGIVDFIDTVNSGSTKKWENYSSRMLSGFVQPVYSSAGRQVGKYFDDVPRDYTPDSENGYLKSIVMRAGETIPGFGSSAPPRYDVWGEEMSYSKGIAKETSFLSPISVKKWKNDPVSDMIASNKMGLVSPLRSIKNVPLTNVEYAEYSKRAGKIAKKELDLAYQYGVFDNLTSGPNGEQVMVVEQILRQARQEARGLMLMDYPELENRIIAQQLESQRQLIEGE